MLGFFSIGAILVFIPTYILDERNVSLVSILFNAGLVVMAIGYIIGSIMRSGGIAIASVDGENVMLTNISGEFIDALTEQRKNAPAPVVEDIAVDPIYRFDDLPDDKKNWRNLDLPD